MQVSFVSFNWHRGHGIARLVRLHEPYLHRRYGAQAMDDSLRSDFHGIKLYKTKRVGKGECRQTCRTSCPAFKSAHVGTAALWRGMIVSNGKDVLSCVFLTSVFEETFLPSRCSCSLS
jgi:hypothetical protein